PDAGHHRVLRRDAGDGDVLGHGAAGGRQPRRAGHPARLVQRQGAVLGPRARRPAAPLAGRRRDHDGAGVTWALPLVYRARAVVQQPNQVTSAPVVATEPSDGPLTIGLLLTVVCIAFDGLAVTTVMPIAVRDLGGLAIYGWAFSAFMLASVVGITLS